MASTSKNHTPRPRDPVHRPHSPKNPPSSPFSTIDIDESETGSPIIPKRVRNRTVPKIVESAFGRNEQSEPVRSSQTHAESSPEFDLLVERRAARKALASGHLEARSAGDEMALAELRDLRRDSPEPVPPSPSASKQGSIEPPASSTPSQPTPRLQSRPSPSTRIDATEKKMIEAREELSRLTVKFREHLPRSSLGSKSPEKRAIEDKTHPFDESTHPFDETTHPFDETTHPFDDSLTQALEVHPFDRDSRAPSQVPHPFDETTQQPPDSILDGQSQHQGLEVRASNTPMRCSSVSHTPGSSKRRAEAFLTTSLLESRKSKASPVDHRRPVLLSPPNNRPRSPQDLATNESATIDNSSRRLKVPTPIITSRSALRSPRSPAEGGSILSPHRDRAAGVSPDESRPRSMATLELRELLENSPRTRRHPQTHGEARIV